MKSLSTSPGGRAGTSQRVPSTYASEVAVLTDRNRVPTLAPAAAETRHELRRAETWRAGAAELIATLLFVFLGAGTVVVTGTLAEGAMYPARMLTIALAHGLAIMMLVAATVKLSGGHINPAVTVAALIFRRISVTRGVVYIIGQVIGAVAGASLIAAVVPGAIDGTLGSHALADDVSRGSGLLTEIILTFVLVYVVLATAMNPKGLVGLAPVIIGLAVLVDHLIGVPLTGASMNPARSFGPALLAGEWTDHWIYWVGPLAGGALAALVQHFLYPARGNTTV